MLGILFAAAFVLLPSSFPEAHAEPAAPARANCQGHQLTLDLAPVGSGPLTLAAVYCQQIRSTPFPKSAPVVSPDGRSIAYYEHDTILRVARLDRGDVWTDYQADLGSFARFEADLVRAVRAYTWASNSQFLWTATHDRVRPNGFAKTPMKAVRTVEGGSLGPLPELRHDAGPLDALLWTGGDGLAVAQFGTRGGSYQPEHDDPTPTFAIVDAQRGRVLDSLPFDAIESLRARRRGAASWAHVRNATATVLRDGKVRVLLSVGQWVLWTQGEAPRTIPDAYAGERFIRMALSPDGSRVLAGRLLRTAGGICRSLQGCSPGDPVEGVLAALHDLDTGRALWSIRATATRDHEFPAPAISEDGRYALVGLMPRDDSVQIALIAMNDGRIVQTLPAPGGAYTMGFARGGRTVWTHAYGVTALYNL
jgi:WD40 repeat protein